MPLKPRALSLLGNTRPGVDRAERQRRGRELIDGHLANVTAEEYSSNDRLVETVLKQSDTRDLSDLLVRAVADHGTDALSEVSDLVAKTAVCNTDTARKLVQNVAVRLRRQGQFVKPGRARGLTEQQPVTTGPLEIEDVIGGLESVARDPSDRTITAISAPASANTSNPSGDEQGEFGATSKQSEPSRSVASVSPTPTNAASPTSAASEANGTPGNQILIAQARGSAEERIAAEKWRIADAEELIKRGPARSQADPTGEKTFDKEAQRLGLDPLKARAISAVMGVTPATEGEVVQLIKQVSAVDRVFGATLVRKMLDNKELTNDDPKRSEGVQGLIRNAGKDVSVTDKVSAAEFFGRVPFHRGGFGARRVPGATKALQNPEPKSKKNRRWDPNALMPKRTRTGEDFDEGFIKWMKESGRSLIKAREANP